MGLEIMRVSEISQSSKDKYHVFSHLWNPGGNQNKTTKVMKVKGGLQGR
jgi:hypothetical protein